MSETEETDTTNMALAYIEVAEALLPEARRLRQMFRDRHRDEVSSDEPDWERVLTASRATNEVCSSIINMYALAAQRNGIDRVRGREVPTADGDLYVASFEDGVIVLTEDGQPMIQQWHDLNVFGSPCDESIRYERWTIDRKRFGHGYVDKRSRAIVQTG